MAAARSGASAPRASWRFDWSAPADTAPLLGLVTTATLPEGTAIEGAVRASGTLDGALDDPQVKADAVKWERIIRDAGLKPQ